MGRQENLLKSLELLHRNHRRGLPAPGHQAPPRPGRYLCRLSQGSPPALVKAFQDKGFDRLYTPPALVLGSRPQRQERRRRHAHGLGKDALLQSARPRRHAQEPGRPRSLSFPDQGPGQRPAGRARRDDQAAARAKSGFSPTTAIRPRTRARPSAPAATSS